jgi:hypothetical protein
MRCGSTDAREIRAEEVANVAGRVCADLAAALHRSQRLDRPDCAHRDEGALSNALARGGSAELPFKVAVMTFGTRSTHLLGFTDQSSLIAPAIARLQIESQAAGKTRLFDCHRGRPGDAAC